MPPSIYNTRTRTTELFVPAQPKVVRIYACGLTTYAPMHAGHARTYCFWDTFRRYLEYQDYHVISVINYTDIDDRIIAKSSPTLGCVDLAERVAANFRRDCRTLHIKDYSAYTRATDFIEEQVSMIATLIDQGHAYVLEGEVLYEVSTFPRYGELSGRSVDEQRVGASERVAEDFARKRHPADFTLWKPSLEGQPCWNTGHADWPIGRPGWHIECSAMSSALLGAHFDVHGGGVDNLFPHHENEIAQSEPICGHPWVRYWLHPEHLDLRGEKMSKSLGNGVGVTELCAAHGHDAVRWFFATHHYRSRLPFSWELLEQAAAGYERIRRLVDLLTSTLSGHGSQPDLGVSGKYSSQRPAETRVPRQRHRFAVGAFGATSDRFVERFQAAMDDDLNTPLAMAATFEYVKALYTSGIDTSTDLPSVFAVYCCLTTHLAVFGIEVARPELNPQLCAEYAFEPLPQVASGRRGDDAVDRLVALRDQARSQKNFAKADMIRALLTESGIEIEDKPDGSRWSAR